MMNKIYKNNVKAIKKYYDNATKEQVIEDMFLDICDLQTKIDKAIEYMKPRFMNCIDNDKRYFEDNDIQEIYEILGGKDE